MEYEFDPVKDAINRDKHGVSLGAAAMLDWEAAVIRPDIRFDYGEERKIALGCIEDRLYCTIFVDREEVRRIISLRKANSREFRDYVRNLEER